MLENQEEGSTGRERCAYQQSKEILKYFEDLATCLLCAFLSAEFFDMNETIFMKTHIFWGN